MLYAKLFVALATLQISVALLESRLGHQSEEVFYNPGSVVIGPILLQVLLALATGCFALTYFAAVRWLSHPLSNSLGLAHFVVATIGFIYISLSVHVLRSAGPPMISISLHWLLVAVSVGLLSFLLGCATFAVNCTWTAIKVFRSHRPRSVTPLRSSSVHFSFRA
jgi:heme/copper-type cytochrome/quinol oxidase subunit 1